MTATTETLWIAYRDTQPSRPLIEEAMRSLATSFERELTLDEKVYYRGQFAGYLVAFGVEEPDTLSVANMTRQSGAYSYDTAAHRMPGYRTVRDRDGYLFACGVQYGYKLGTTHRGDAEECAGCGRRICLGADDYHNCCGHFFCDTGVRDCWTDWHREAQSVGCLYADDLRDEPNDDNR